ncbi:MAG: squalene/phytoene synthase family protein [Hyphomicrobiales bacterium]|nr:squalene/phytoene synthase family protein [Hyphomicrobiales bacterium]
MPDPSHQSHDYCLQLVRQTDHDRYLATLLAPEPARDQLSPLYAFDAEIARIRGLVTEASLGEIRYQWWLDAIDAIYEERSAEPHPVLIGLEPVIKAAELPKLAFINLIEARRFDLYDDPMPSLNDLEGYLGETSSIVMQLASTVLAGNDAFELSDVTGSAGVAQGLTRLLTTLPAQCARGQCYVPLDLLEKCDLTPAHVLAGRQGQGLDGIVSELSAHAQKRLSEARQRMAHVPAKALPALWPASLVDLYLKRLAKPGGNPFKQITEVSQFRRQVRLMKMSMTKTF